MRSFPVLVGLLFLILLTASCSSLIKQSDYSYEILSQADKHVARKEYGKALTRMQKFNIASSSDREAAQYFYLRGAARLGLNEHSLARYDFERALKIAYYGREKSRIEMGIGESYYRQNEFASAMPHFLAALSHEPGVMEEDELFYKLAVCCQKQGQGEKGRDWFDKVSFYEPSRDDVLVYQEEYISPGTDEDEGTQWATLFSSGGGIISRKAWSARARRSNCISMGHINRITLHHSGKEVVFSDYHATARLIRNIQLFHQGTKGSGGRGWADIGYHYILDRNGRIWEGRSVRIQGAHAGNHQTNQGNIGIVVLGNYDFQKITSDQKEALSALIAWLMDQCTVPVSRLYGHCDLKPTHCPGKNLRRFLKEFRSSMGDSLTLSKNNTNHHVVQTGENLSSIARKYRTTLTSLRRVNHLFTGDHILVGQKLIIP